MNIKRAKEEIKDTVAAYLDKDEYGAYRIPAVRQRPVLLIGPPGVGKTQIMEQAARECGIALVAYTITHHTRQSAIGLPYIEKKFYDGKEYAVTEYTMSEIVASIYDKIEAAGLKEGILFLDEINCVSETLAPAMLQFLQCKSFGNHKIPEGWVIVAAGNPPEYNKSVREFDLVTLDRIRRIDVEADFEVWKEYAFQVQIHPAVLSYLSIRTQNFCQLESTVDGKRFATPRGWEDLSCLIEVYERLGKAVDRDVVFEYIQNLKIAKDFANYLELYYKYQQDYQVEDILDGHISEGIFLKLERAAFDERFSMIGLLLDGLNRQYRMIRLEECRMERIQACLKRYRVMLDQQGVDAMQARLFLAAVIGGQRDEYERQKAAGLLEREEEHLLLDVIARLEMYQKKLQLSGADQQGGEIMWDHLKELFEGDSDRFEILEETGSRMTECAFDFLEAAFGEGQEMTAFISGLNIGRDSIHFLQGYECERYFQYNKTLLFSERETQLLDKINRL